MKTNEAGWDSGIRIVLGLALLSLMFVGPRTLWGLAGIVPLATGSVGFCPLYAFFGFSTSSIESKGAPGPGISR